MPNVWLQNYDPLQNPLLSTSVAALPVVVLLGSIAVLRIRIHFSALLGLGFFGLRAVLRVLSPAESDALLGVSAAASLDDDRALYRDTEWPVEQVEKFKPYSTASLYAFAREGFLSTNGKRSPA